VRAAAITNSTTVVERPLPRRAKLIEPATERLQKPDPEDVVKYSRSLARMIVPVEMKEILQQAEPLVVEVDRVLARVQWEMLPPGTDDEPLGVRRAVARQLRTFYSPRPFEPDGRRSLRALVIGDPGDERISLPSAREEAQLVHELRTKSGIDTLLLLGAPEDGTRAGVVDGVPPADYFEVIDHLLSGEFDIVHFCGHATFEVDTPDRTGWAFKDGILTASELDGMERPPRLLVANACLSAQLSQVVAAPATGAARSAIGDSALVAGLADGFFRRGVSDYIGSSWEVESEPAKEFVRQLYGELFGQAVRGIAIGEAVRRARKHLYENRATYGTAWAAYQHYGDPARIIEREPSRRAAPPRKPA
jgi:hypothetical protein